MTLKTPLNEEISLLLQRLFDFYQERDWEQFHSPKNLAMDLASEMGELVDPIQATYQKIESLEKKYPVESAKGKSWNKRSKKQLS